MKSLRQYVADSEIPLLEQIVVATDDRVELHEGRKWISGRVDRNIGIDQPTHGVGHTHAHVYGRMRDKNVLIVNIDGSGSHGVFGEDMRRVVGRS